MLGPRCHLLPLARAVAARAVLAQVGAGSQPGVARPVEVPAHSEEGRVNTAPKKTRQSSETHLYSSTLRDERRRRRGTPLSGPSQVLQRNDGGLDAREAVGLGVPRGERHRDAGVIHRVAGGDVRVERAQECAAVGRARAWDLDGLAVRPCDAVAVPGACRFRLICGHCSGK